MTGPWVSGWAKARTAVLALVAVIGLTALELARQPGTRSWQSMWAEDGTVYGTDAFALSLPSTILRGYAGYVQVVPRVLALAVPAVPVTRVAAVFAFEASLVTALLAVSVYRCSEGWIDHRGLRTVVAAMTALVPIAYLETSTNIANLGWPLLVASGWALVSRRDQLVDTVLRIVVVVATALSTTLAALFWPAAVAVAVRRRQRRDWAVFAALSVGLGLQFVLDHFASGPGRSHVTSSFGDLVQVFGVRVVGSALWGERWLPDAWRRWHYGLVVVAVASLALVVFACRRAPADRRWFAVAALVFAFVLFAVPVWARGSSPMRMHASHLNVVGARYLVAPVVVLVSGFAVLVDGARRRWLQSLMVVHSVVLIVVSFQLVNPRSDATPWWTLVQEARADCVAKPNTAVVDLRITPSPWTIGIRCERLRDPFVVAG